MTKTRSIRIHRHCILRAGRDRDAVGAGTRAQDAALIEAAKKEGKPPTIRHA